MSEGDNPNPHNITDPMWRLWSEGLAVLEPTSQLGGIYAVKSGFHNTIASNQRFWPLNYSIRDAINQQGPRDKAAAIDWVFPEAQRGDYRRINLYSDRLDAASRARDPRLAGWYEWFGTKSGANIGWNIFQNRFSASDDSHDWHIHASEIRAYVESRANKAAFLSVLSGESLAAYLARGGQLITTGGDDMSAEDVWKVAIGSPALAEQVNPRWASQPASEYLKYTVDAAHKVEQALVKLDVLTGVIEQLAAAITKGGGSVDTAAILRGVDERLEAHRVKVEADTRDAVADLGEGGAAAVRADAS